VQADGEVWVYYLVGVDDQTITTITVNPLQVRTLQMKDTPVRVACQHHSHGPARTLLGVLLPDRGGTPWCEDLAACLRAIPQASDRAGNPAIDGCLEAATVTRPND
jgi:hypothetical protein